MALRAAVAGVAPVIAAVPLLERHPVLSRCCNHLVGDRRYFGRGALFRGPGLCGASMG